MIWKRINQVTPEQEQEFQERMSQENVSVADKVIMVITSFFVIVIPCAVVLIGISLLTLWIFGLL